MTPSSSEGQRPFNPFGFAHAERQIVPYATERDIDLKAFRSFMRAQGRQIGKEPRSAIEEDLKNASVCEWIDRTLRPTLYGLMVFGREPQGHPHTTNLFIQCAVYAGDNRACDVLSAGEGKGRLDEQVSRVMGWFRSLGRRECYGKLYRANIPMIPEEALREALVNAVIHRDYALTGSRVFLEIYDDRIDVTSPGVLPNRMTVEQARFGGAARSRNEMMASAMVVRGLMEPRGRGWLRMRYVMSEFNGSEPGLVNDEDGRFVRVTFRFDPETAVNVA